MIAKMILLILVPVLTHALPLPFPQSSESLTSVQKNDTSFRPSVVTNQFKREVNLMSGGSNGGGGNICFMGQKAVLLELSDFNSKFTSEPGARKKILDDFFFSLVPFSPIFTLPEDQERDLYNFRLIKDRVDKVLAANQKNSPFLVRTLQYITHHFAFSFVNYSVDVPVFASFSFQKKCTIENTKASILYAPPMMGFIDINQFQKLDLNSQAGLVIHESFRTLQYLITESLQDKSGFSIVLSDEQVQEFVRIMFQTYLEEDSSIENESLDSSELVATLARFDQNKTLNILAQYERINSETKTSFLNAIPNYFQLFDLVFRFKQYPKSFPGSERDQFNSFLQARCRAVENMRQLFKEGRLVSGLNEQNFNEQMVLPNVKCAGDLIPGFIMKFDQHIENLKANN